MKIWTSTTHTVNMDLTPRGPEDGKEPKEPTGDQDALHERTAKAQNSA